MTAGRELDLRTGALATTAAGARPGWLPRQYNRVVAALGPLGLAPASLELAPMLAAVERRLGRRFCPDGGWDFSRGAFADALSHYAAGLELTPFGRLILRQTVLRNLASALRLQAAREAHPALFDRPPIAPIMIVGVHRSGTTLLHRLLAAHPRLRAPRTWEVYDPVPRLPRRRWRTALRRRGAQLELGLGRLAVPDLDAAHYIRAGSFEESSFLLEPSGVLFSAIFAFGAHGHARWLMARDIGPAYRRLGDLLALIEPGPPAGGRWLLKDPLTTWHLGAFLDVFPDARIIQLHRPLHASLASACSFAAVLQRGSRPSVDFERLGADMASLYVRGLRRATAARAARPGARCLDVRYADLVADPRGAVDRVVRWLELPPMPADRACPPERSTPRHVYDAAQFGLDPERLAALRASAEGDPS